MPSEAEGATRDFGDVVLVPFPFTSHDSSKRRPAVIVSGRAYNAARPDVVMMPVTSQLRPTRAPGEVWLKGWKAAGLLKPSAIKPVIATLEQGMILRRLGVLDGEDQAALRRAMAEILG